MTNEGMAERISEGSGFIAALDQSGGSTPEALLDYGVPASAYANDVEMHRLMHEMRVRVMTAPAFVGDRVIGAILFEQTMDGTAQGKPVPAFLWEDRRVVPFLKVDKGREPEADGVQLMKPNPGLEALLARASQKGIYGTKMRSVIRLASRSGIEKIVAQQFEVAAKIADHGLMPIIEPEVLINSPDKAGAEAILLEELTRQLGLWPDGRPVMLKLTIPEVPDFYRGLAVHDKITRLVALSGGYKQSEACSKLAMNYDMIGSFSRALLEGLKQPMSDEDFDASLSRSIDRIYEASTKKG